VQLGLQLHWSVAFETPIDNISIAVAHEVESLAHDIVKICEASGFCIPVLVISPSFSPLFRNFWTISEARDRVFIPTAAGAGNERGI
jgi:hypothetical protein